MHVCCCSAAEPNGLDMAGERWPWLERLAIIGAAARGFVFVVIGSSAINAAFQARRSSHDLASAFEIIIVAPMGRVLLAVVASGLMAFGIWCLLEAILDTRGKGSAAKGFAQRSAGIVVGCIYCALSLAALGLAFDVTEPGGPGIRSWTALLLSQPFGQWLTAIVGLVVVAVGAFQVGAAFCRARKRTDQLRRRALESYGLASRGLLFLVTGGFMIVAAIFRAPGEARGLRGAFRFLGQQPFGLTLVCIVGAGLAVHGIMSALDAYRCHRRFAELPI